MSSLADKDPVAAIQMLRRVRLLLPVAGLAMIAAVWFLADLEPDFRRLVMGVFLFVIVFQFVTMTLFIRHQERKLSA